jgi:hypothetical protein
VPAPPPHDHHAPRPKEVDAALKSLDKPAQPERPARAERSEPPERPVRKADPGEDGA